MRGYYKKKLLVILLLIVFVLPILPVGATQSTREQMRELEERRAIHQQRVAEQETLLAGTEFEMSVVLTQLRELDQLMVDTLDMLDVIEFDMLVTEIRIYDAEAELEAVRQERDQQNEILRIRVRDMHEIGNIGLLAVLFQAESITDFFARWEYIRMVAQFDRDLLDNLDAMEARELAIIEDLSRAHVMIRDLIVQQQRTLLLIEEQMEERRAFFEILSEDAEREAEFLMILEVEAHALDLAFGIVRELYLAEVAEAERIRQAQLAAQRAAAAAVRAEELAARLAHLDSFDDFAWPLPGHSLISSPFGYRQDPFNRARTQFHTGIDLPAPSGTRIVAAEAGYVTFAGWNAGWGWQVIIRHADDYSTMYAHNTRNHVVAGQRVERGQHIADVGSTGHSTGPHLHFEILLDGMRVNPMRYFGG